eukprot:TRINITY_DN10726_c0_g1_i4.p1 TRINITY_DN10726_c0_g1~~TRINITY_DN10726_c0_g1_i4.p1  ORF type:complete len:184 (-),score=52.47 TRINITY_DN10726_c0_g1_i4:90-641(-)
MCIRDSINAEYGEVWPGMSCKSTGPRSRIKVVSSCAKLQAELDKAADRLVVLEFYSQSVSPCRKIQEQLAALSLEHTAAVFLKVNLDFWEEIEDLLPRFDSNPGALHVGDGNPNTYIDPSKKLVMYAHVQNSDTVLQRYQVTGLPTFQLHRGQEKVAEVLGADLQKLDAALIEATSPMANPTL